MKIDRMDTVAGEVYIMTETHRYADVLQIVKKIEPLIKPIKHVNVDLPTLATGYRVPAKTASLEKLVDVLKGTVV